MLKDPEKFLGRTGFVKLAKGIYTFGKVTETDMAGAGGWVLVVNCVTKSGYEIKIGLLNPQSLRSSCPNNAVVISA